METMTAPTGTSSSAMASPASSRAISICARWNGWRGSVNGRSNGSHSEITQPLLLRFSRQVVPKPIAVAAAQGNISVGRHVPAVEFEHAADDADQLPVV